METQGRTLAKRENVLLSVKLRETWPFPTDIVSFQISNTIFSLTRSSEGTLEGNSVGLDGPDSVIGDNSLSVLQDGCNIDLLPNDRNLGSREDRLDRLGDLGTDTYRSD
jgi:hypothetical protein